MSEANTQRRKSYNVPQGAWRKDVPEGLEYGLRNYWYPVVLSTEVLRDKPFAVTALCEDLVIWRDGHGAPHIFVDSCPHRAVKLSAGCITGDLLQCAYHGLQFDGSGQCLFIPWEGEGTEKCKAVHARVYPALEAGGLIWGYIGDVAKFPAPSPEEFLPLEMRREGFVNYAARAEPWEVNWLLAWDGSFDPQHNAFIHTDSDTIRLLGGRTGGSYRMSTRDLVNGVKLQRLAPDGNVQCDLAGGWMLPAMATIVTVFDHGTVVSRSWRYPLSGNRTQVVRSWSRIARTDEEKSFWEHLFRTVVLPETTKIDIQDREILHTQRGLVHARSNEQLLNCDVGIVRTRRMLRDTFLAQKDGRRLQPSTWSPLLSDAWVGHIDNPPGTSTTFQGQLGRID